MRIVPCVATLLGDAGAGQTAGQEEGEGGQGSSLPAAGDYSWGDVQGEAETVAVDAATLMDAASLEQLAQRLREVDWVFVELPLVAVAAQRLEVAPIVRPAAAERRDVVYVGVALAKIRSAVATSMVLRFQDRSNVCGCMLSNRE